jgi:hypothetical protein
MRLNCKGSILTFAWIIVWNRFSDCPIANRMKRVIAQLSDLVVVATLIVALTAVGFAHRVSAQSLNADLEAFLLSGGTLSGLCGDIQDPKNARADECSACRLMATTTVPENFTHSIEARLPQTLRLMRLAQLRHHAAPRDPSQQTRAPPQA